MQLVMDFTAPYQAHSGTSREAASSMKGKSARLREQVLNELRKHPATDEELATVLRLSGNNGSRIDIGGDAKRVKLGDVNTFGALSEQMQDDV